MSHHIVLTGVESTFKSALAKALGDYLALELVDEYAQTFSQALDATIALTHFPVVPLPPTYDVKLQLQHAH